MWVEVKGPIAHFEVMTIAEIYLLTNLAIPHRIRYAPTKSFIRPFKPLRLLSGGHANNSGEKVCASNRRIGSHTHRRSP
jgi:hypothetical protein